MERRKILLGSGAALATVFAGCSSSETDEPRSGDTDEIDGDDSDTDGDGGDDQDDADATDEDTTDETDGEDAPEEIPGFEEEAVEADGDLVSITDVARDDETVTVLAETDTLDEDELQAELEAVGLAFVDAIVDIEAFAAEITTIPWHIKFNDNNIASFHIEVDWITAYKNGELSEDELVEQILETV